jgi:TPR repeat protein
LKDLAKTSAQGQYLLAQCYFRGVAVDVDMALAREWLMRAEGNGLFREKKDDGVKWEILAWI